MNPRDNPDKEFIYLDIASIEAQRITTPKRYYGRNAPSRARQRVKSGDIIFSTVRTYLKNVAMVDHIYDGQIASTGFCIIRPVNDINNKFIFYLTVTDDFVDSLTRLQRGTSYPAVRDSDVLSRPIFLPPFQEQHRIVTKIEELFTKLDTGISALKKAKIQLKQYRQSLLKDAFEGKLTEDLRNIHTNDMEPASILLERVTKEREKNKIEKFGQVPTNFKLSLTALPIGWIWVQVGDIFDVIMGQSPPGTSYNTDHKGLPLLNGPTEFGDSSPLPVQWTTDPTRLSEKNDLLICVRGNTTGRMNWSDQKYCIGRGLAAIRPYSSELNIKLLYYFLKIKTDELMMKTTGSTFPNLKGNELKGFIFPLAPALEQNVMVQKIEYMLSIVDNIENTIEQGLRQADRLRKSILKTAFQGKLISQDSTEGTAEMLLQMIKEDRAKTGQGDMSKEIDVKPYSKQERLI